MEITETTEEFVKKLNQLKIKHQQYVVPVTDKVKEELKNQQNMCYICCGEFSFNEDGSQDDVVLKTNCNHYFHYNCLLESIKSKKTYYSHSRQECPYCRSQIGWLPKLNDNHQLLKHVHKEYYNMTYKPTAVCQAIVKSGKKKGLICGCKVKTIGGILCGRHKNYKFPKPKEENIKLDVNQAKEKLKSYQNSWFLGKLLKCY